MRKRSRRLLYIPKDKKVKTDNLRQMLFSSFFGMVVCIGCLIGLTMAWFSAGVRTSDTFSASRFVISATVEYMADGSSRQVEQRDGSYYLDAEQAGEYVVTLTGQAAGGRGNGYGIFSLTGDSADESKNPIEAAYITEPIRYTGAAYDTIRFTIRTNVSCVLKIGSGWGTCVAGQTVNNNSTVEFYSSVQAALDAALAEEETEEPSEEEPKLDEAAQPDEASETEKTVEETDSPETAKPQETEKAEEKETKTDGGNEVETYMVKENDTLDEIALRFGTTTEKLVAYNDIAGEDLENDMILKIPPKNYEIPQINEPEEKEN